jgi:arabinogalactan endo-1,4-beta-galactosidase
MAGANTIFVLLGLLANPGFEQDGTGVADPAGWRSVGTVEADFTEAGGHSGDLRLTHFSTTPFEVETRQTYKNLRDGWYTLRARVRRSTGDNESTIELRCGDRAERAHVPAAPAHQWLQVTVSSPVRSRS